MGLIYNLFLYFVFLFELIWAGRLDVNEIERIKYLIDIEEKSIDFPRTSDYLKLSFENEEQIREFLENRLPSTSDPSNIFIKNRSGQPFACQISSLSLKRMKEKEKFNVNDDTFNPKYVKEIIDSAFQGQKCIRKKTGWWIFEFCRENHIKQYHSIKGKTDFMEYSLGIFTGIHRMPDFTHSTKEKLLYMEEEYQLGTICEVPGKRVPRKTIIRYECGLRYSTGEAYIQSIVEVSTCEYLMIVQVGSLCHLPQFVAIDDQIEPTEIKCFPFIDQETIRQMATNIYRKISRKREGDRMLPIIMEELKSIYRRLNTFKRTKINREERRNFRIKRRIKNEIDRLNWELMNVLYMRLEGEEIDEKGYKKLDSLVKLSQAFVENENYDDIWDEDRGNLYYFMKDRKWPKDEYPRNIDHVDFLNAFHYEMEKLILKAKTQEEADRYELIDPLKWKELKGNPLITDKDIMDYLLTSLPIWFPKLTLKELKANAGRKSFLKKIVDHYFLYILDEKEELKRDNQDWMIDVTIQVAGYAALLQLEEKLKDLDKYIDLIEMIAAAKQFAKLLYSIENPRIVDLEGDRFQPEIIEIVEEMDWTEYYEFIDYTVIPGKRKDLRNKYSERLTLAIDSFIEKASEKAWNLKKKQMIMNWRIKLMMEEAMEIEEFNESVDEEISKTLIESLYQKEDKEALLKHILDLLIQEGELDDLLDSGLFTDHDLLTLTEAMIGKELDNSFTHRNTAKQEKNYWIDLREEDQDEEDQDQIN